MASELKEHMAQDTRRYRGAILLAIAIMVVIGVGAWVSTFFHPAGL